jgi:hypothetical protein
MTTRWVAHATTSATEDRPGGLPERGEAWPGKTAEEPGRSRADGFKGHESFPTPAAGAATAPTSDLPRLDTIPSRRSPGFASASPRFPFQTPSETQPGVPTLLPNASRAVKPGDGFDGFTQGRFLLRRGKQERVERFSSPGVLENWPGAVGSGRRLTLAVRPGCFLEFSSSRASRRAPVFPGRSPPQPGSRPFAIHPTPPPRSNQ